MAAPVQETISIGSKADTRGFKKADSAAQKLNKTLRNLGFALGTTALVSYGKAAVKAFAADEAAANRLATAVDNLGLSFSQAQVKTFIADLEASAAIADDVLRPAFQGLLTTTGSLTKSQELLNNAIQISRASGIDLATVATDLGKGYVGITRGLIKYNTGLTRAEITTKSFNEILGIMLARSAGAAQDYLTTTSYKMEVLTVAAGNAQETIGSGLVDAFAKIGGGSSATEAAQTIDTIAKSINTMTQGIGLAVGALVKLYRAFDYVGSLGGLLGENGSLFSQFEDKPNTNRSKSPAGTAARTAQQRQAEAAAAKRAKELAALTKKQVDSQKKLTAEQKKQAALKKSGTLFDVEQAGILAALQGQISESDRKRLELQFSLLTENAKTAQQLTYEIAKAQGLGEDLARYLSSLPDAKNPFASWDAYLDEIIRKARAAASVSSSAGIGPFYGQSGAEATAKMPPPTNVPPAASLAPTMKVLNPAYTPATGYSGAEATRNSIVVQIDGKAVASALQDSSLSGIGSSVNRLNRLL